MRYNLTYREDFVSRNRSQFEVTPEDIEQRVTSFLHEHDVKREEEPLLSIIYAVDETGLPSSDLAMYLSDKCNPEVRDYIQRNILVDVGSTPLETAELDDDTIMNLTRGADESRQVYIARVNQYMSDIVDKTKSDVEFQNFKNSLKNGKSQ